jgi:spermidine/putrescine transport system substrate-binding protein
MSRLILVFFVILIAASCTKNNQPEVNIAIWNNYLTEEVKQQFTKETGIKLNVLNFSSNEELLAKVQAGGAGIDVAVPSDYMVGVMIKLALLHEVQKDLIPSAAQIEPRMLQQSYDPKNQYSLPYAWITAGIAVRKDLYNKAILSWKDVIDNPELKGKIALLDDYREVTAAALKIDNESVNSINTEALQSAKLRMASLKNSAKMFTSDSVDILKNKEILVAHAYSSDALQAAAATNGKVDFIIPIEGGTRSLDNLVILKKTQHLPQAHQLVNFLLRKDINVEFVKKIKASPVVMGVRELLPAELRDSPILFPSAQKLSKLESLVDLGEKNKLYEEIWTALKSGN